ncbi:hypothetical protein K7Z75_18365 [Mycobacterium avium subsp. hominissuis]|uniref:hypothetical protein n=1 Tax=Mycobacterium avium TaxID=1764 RepID=UPI00293B69C5|nr:hypothetical protein [Mycobacterium avium]MDV3305627.1 hypothetical protein [Mycobacterium avium subsp. hominissuis]
MALLLASHAVLIIFIVGGIVALITRGVRRSRANKLDPQWKQHRTQPGYEASVYGAMPNTPLPEWAYWNDDVDGEQHDDRAG